MDKNQLELRIIQIPEFKLLAKHTKHKLVSRCILEYMEFVNRGMDKYSALKKLVEEIYIK